MAWRAGVLALLVALTVAVLVLSRSFLLGSGSRLNGSGLLLVMLLLSAAVVMMLLVSVILVGLTRRLLCGRGSLGGSRCLGLCLLYCFCLYLCCLG